MSPISQHSPTAAFRVILLTAFLDIFGLGLIIPILPKIMRDFAAASNLAATDPIGSAILSFFSRFADDPSSFANGVAFSLFSVGMLAGGMVFWTLSDRIGRKRTLLFTSALGVGGYAIFGLSGSLSLFLLGRFLSGLSGGSFPVTQAYISDLFDPKERAVRVGMVGAAFGTGFAVGPVLGWLLSSFGLQTVGLFSAAALAIDFILIAFVLPDSPKRSFHTHSGDPKPETLPIPWGELLPVYAVGFIVAFGFSGMQSTFGLIIPDRFHVDQKIVGYFLGIVGVTSILYQGFFIKTMRKVFLEKGLMLFGLSVMSFAFFLFAANPFFAVAGFCSALFSVGLWSINASASALISRIAPGHAGKALGFNGSTMALANIFGPILAGALYSFAPPWESLHGFWTYAVAAALFAAALPIAYFGISKKHPVFAR